MKRIGILGGMGPQATRYFLNLLLESINRSIRPLKDQEYPDMTILMESSMPDRTVSIKENQFQAKIRINNCIAELFKTGCNMIAIPCVTAHSFVDRQWFETGVIDFRKSIVRHYGDDKNKRVAVMATDGSIISGVFEPLADYFDLVFPDDLTQHRIMEITYGEKGLKAHDIDCAVRLKEMEEIKEELYRRGAELIIAGCTEIEMFLGSQNSTGNCVLPMAAMCEEIIRRLEEKD